MWTCVCGFGATSPPNARHVALAGSENACADWARLKSTASLL
jgi:hypothetical protein